MLVDKQEFAQKTNQINPNKVFFTTKKVRVVNSMPVNPKEFGGCDVEKIFKIFKGISNKKKKRVNRVVKYATDTNEDIVQLALKIYNSLEYSDIEQFLSVVEIVGFEVLSGPKTSDDMMNDIRTNYNEYIDNIRIDITTAEQIASQRDVNFRDPLKAVYHYRKHGHEFASEFNGQSIENYLNIVPNQLITDNNLVEMTTNQDGTISKIYNTPDNWFAEVVENKDSQIIKTMHERKGSYHKFSERLTAAQEGWTRPNPMDTLPLIISDSMGFRGCTIQLILESGETFQMEP